LISPAATGHDSWYQRRCILGMGGDGRPQLFSALVIGGDDDCWRVGGGSSGPSRRLHRSGAFHLLRLRQHSARAPFCSAAATPSSSVCCSGSSLRRIFWWCVVTQVCCVESGGEWRGFRRVGGHVRQRCWTAGLERWRTGVGDSRRPAGFHSRRPDGWRW